MINGIKITEIPLVQSQLINHQRKLKQISSQNPQKKQLDFKKHKSCTKHNPFFLSADQSIRLYKQKNTHMKSFHWKRQRKQQQIEHQNNLILEKLIEIDRKKTSLSQVNPNCHPGKMGKYFNYRKKQQMAIQATNVDIAKRIMTQTGYMDHNKDIQNFNKTRQIAHRLQKFRIVDKMMSPKRNKSMPSKLPTLKTEPNNQSEIRKYEE